MAMKIEEKCERRSRTVSDDVLRLLRRGTFFLMVTFVGIEGLSGRALAESVRPASETVPFTRPVEVKEADRAAPAAGIESQYQLQLLQQEVMELRGRLEELNHRFDQMQATGDDRYLELDRRFQELSAQLSARPGAAVVSRDTPSTAETGEDPAGGEDEKTLYETALELIRNRQYDLAITQLQAVIAQFPDGHYAPNAYYWLGEVYAAKPEPDYEKARQALAQVISFFPEHRKVPDAAFKLGKVYYLMGDCDRATSILNQVIEQQQGRTVAKLAEAYLRDKVHCEKQ